MNDEGVHSKK
jgi:hypothetical protein